MKPFGTMPQRWTALVAMMVGTSTLVHGAMMNKDEDSGAFGRLVMMETDRDAAFRELLELDDLSMSLSMSYPPPSSSTTTAAPTTVSTTLQPAATVASTTVVPDTTDAPSSIATTTVVTVTPTVDPTTAVPTTATPGATLITSAPTDSSTPFVDLLLTCETVPSVDVIANWDVETTTPLLNLTVLESILTEALSLSFNFCNNDERRRMTGVPLLLGPIEAEAVGDCTPVETEATCTHVQMTVPLLVDTSEQAIAQVSEGLDAALVDAQDELAAQGMTVRSTGNAALAAQETPESSSSGPDTTKVVYTAVLTVASAAVAFVLVAVASRKISSARAQEKEDYDTLSKSCAASVMEGGPGAVSSV